MKSPAIVAISGFSSEVGKTTVMCDLLRAFPGWEAIKVTRGHYRSCGKDPDACCVSELLGDEPVIRSGREQNYAPGKDTGRFWDAGAVNVHWVIVTDVQVEQGITQALARVQAPGVLVEGNSILDFIEADFVLMVAKASGGTIKGSARRALSRASALYLSNIRESANESTENSNGAADVSDERTRFARWRKRSGMDALIGDLPIYTAADLPLLVAHVRSAVSVDAAADLIATA